MSAPMKYHDRPSPEYSHLVPVASFKAQLAQVYSQQRAEGLAGKTREDLLDTVGALCDEELEALTESCWFISYNIT